jgi:hypothetical protein
MRRQDVSDARPLLAGKLKRSEFSGDRHSARPTVRQTRTRCATDEFVGTAPNRGERGELNIMQEGSCLDALPERWRTKAN